MAKAPTNEPTVQNPLRLWPAIVIVVVQWLSRFVLPVIVPESLPFAVMGGLFAGLLLLVWWVFFSRAPWSERLGATVLIIGAVAATPSILHESIATGNMGFMFPLYAVPVLSLAFVVWAAASHRLDVGPRRAAMVATILLSCGVWALFQTGGNTIDLDHDFSWRWTQTPEERLLAEADQEQMALAKIPPVSEAEAGMPVSAWPGFRGPERNSIIHGVQIETDWTLSPPAELWRRPIGPGWSSFAVHGGLLYTQEQRGEDEVVSCYETATGQPVWRHHDAARFWESVGGAGPRGTPTLDGGRVYTLGATGIVNVLNAADGSVVWSRNAAEDTAAELPIWGFSGSPLVVDDVVLVAASGGLAAYDLNTGVLRWSRPADGDGYSSPHLLRLDGAEQVVQLSREGIVGVTPTDGTLLWQHLWSGEPIVQPGQTADGDLLLSVSASSGMRRIAVTRGAAGWTAEERWTSLGLKSYFNDFVVHQGHAFGIEGSILASINLENGERQWKGGRYGGGQLFLLADQDVLLVLSERGELALVRATPDRFEELARFQALEGKTWNHPVLVDDLLLVRNGQEMAAFRLALVGGGQQASK